LSHILDYEGLAGLIHGVLEERRRVLLEHEVYELLDCLGLRTPSRVLLEVEARADEELLESFSGGRIVLKMVSEQLLHKSEAGGVRIVERSVDAVDRALAELRASAPAPLRGILLVEHVSYSGEFGSELLLGVRWSREFGPVITFGAGGTDAEYYAQRLQPGRGHAIRSAADFDEAAALEMLRRTAVYERLSGGTRGSSRTVEDSGLVRALCAFAELAREFSPLAGKAPCLLEELEVNPLVVSKGGLMPLDGLMRLGELPRPAPARPLHKIRNLLHARSVALAGVSRRMNIGRTILQNLLDADFPRERIHIVKPGETEIAGIPCVAQPAELPEKVDLFVLAVNAEQVPATLEAIGECDCAESVIVIPGGIAEKEGGGAIGEELDRVIARARELPGAGPVIVGSNCLGIYSREAGVNTLFIPEYKLPRPAGDAGGGIAYLSQSGAFMISRMSRIADLDPVYALSLGNQTDLTVGDFIEYLAEDPDTDLVACYVEGFRDLDGLKAVRTARRLAGRGKRLLLYKAGRTAEGRSASEGHTASIAGDFETCRQLFQAAGADALEFFEDFESRVRLHHGLRGKLPPPGAEKARAPGVGLISNAGFECVGMADNLRRTVQGREVRMELANFAPATEERLHRAFSSSGIDALVDVRNPLDLTPMADERVWEDCLRAVLEDPGVDAAVVSIVPLTAAMQTLPPADHHGEDLGASEAICARLAKLRATCDTPFVTAVDSGALYDPLVRELERAGIPVFRFADQATRFLAKFLDSL